MIYFNLLLIREAATWIDMLYYYHVNNYLIVWSNTEYNTLCYWKLPELEGTVVRSSTCWLSRPSWFSMLTFGSIWFIMQKIQYIGANLQNSLLFPHVFNKDPGCNCGCCMLLCYLLPAEFLIGVWRLYYYYMEVLPFLKQWFFWWVSVGGALGEQAF